MVKELIQEWGRWLVKWASENPGSFVSTILLILSPFLVISAYLSWKLAKHIEADQKKKKAQKKRLDNIKAALNGDNKESDKERRVPGRRKRD
ncbi:Small integral membrane protein 15 [Halotydeus destructor]|nr:Small integral membrane protein 15 [Halotydeus destructor]